MASYAPIRRSAYPPAQRPILIWDGQCGFCAYWLERWRSLLGQRLDYRAFQDLNPEEFQDIERNVFQEALQLIETDGQLYGGAHAAYRSLAYISRFWRWVENLYQRRSWFRRLSDGAYRWISKNRGHLLRPTHWMWGQNPAHPRPFWFIYLALLLYLVYALV